MSKTKTKRPVYRESAALQSSRKALAAWEKAKPGAYSGKYTARLDELLERTLNRPAFRYNVAEDPLYRQLRDRAVRGGRLAMEDTVGRASALTGGYANSYAVTAGSEAYRRYLEGLNDSALELYDRALAAYDREGDKLKADADLLRGLDADDYKRYRDRLDSYYDEGNYLLQKLSKMSDSEYKRFVQDSKAWENDRDYANRTAQAEREYALKVAADKLKREQFERELAFKRSEAERDQRNKDRAYALSAAKAAAGSSGGGGSSGSSKSTGKTASAKTPYFRVPRSYSEFYKATGYAGIMTPAQFGASSSRMKQYGSYQNYLRAMYSKYKNGYKV